MELLYMKKLKSILNKKALVAALALTGFTSSGLDAATVFDNTAKVAGLPAYNNTALGTAAPSGADHVDLSLKVAGTTINSPLDFPATSSPNIDTLEQAMLGVLLGQSRLLMYCSILNAVASSKGKGALVVTATGTSNTIVDLVASVFTKHPSVKNLTITGSSVASLKAAITDIAKGYSGLAVHDVQAATTATTAVFRESVSFDEFMADIAKSVDLDYLAANSQWSTIQTALQSVWDLNSNAFIACDDRNSLVTAFKTAITNFSTSRNITLMPGAVDNMIKTFSGYDASFDQTSSGYSHTGSAYALNTMLGLFLNTGSVNAFLKLIPGSANSAASSFSLISNAELISLQLEFAKVIYAGSTSSWTAPTLSLLDNTGGAATTLSGTGVLSSAFGSWSSAPGSTAVLAFINNVLASASSASAAYTQLQSIATITDANGKKINEVYNDAATATMPQLTQAQVNAMIQYVLIGWNGLVGASTAVNYTPIANANDPLYAIFDQVINLNDISGYIAADTTNGWSDTALIFKALPVGNVPLGLLYSKLQNLWLGNATTATWFNGTASSDQKQKFIGYMMALAAEKLQIGGIQLSDVAAAGYAKKNDLITDVNATTAATGSLKAALDAVYAPKLTGPSGYVIAASATGTNVNVDDAVKTVVAPASGTTTTSVALDARYVNEADFGTQFSATGTGTMRTALDAIYAAKPASGGSYVTEAALAAEFTASGSGSLKTALEAVYAKTADLKTYGLANLGSTATTTALSGLDKDVAGIVSQKMTVAASGGAANASTGSLTVFKMAQKLITEAEINAASHATDRS
ncbi:MAG: hypothetical protein CNLJKLNK_00067 [Holosporales bacterium]